MHKTWLLRGSLFLTSLTLCELWQPDARADASTSQTADELFRAGKAALAEGDFTQACPSLARSFELETATGTLLALAICHEREGRLASAQHEYGEVAARSTTEGRTDRAVAAAKKAADLESQVSKLRIDGPGADAPPALSVKLNGLALAPAQLGQPLMVDGGPLLVEASAPGYQPWQARVVVAASRDLQTLTIPELQPLAESEPPAASRAAPPQPPKKEEQLPRRVPEPETLPRSGLNARQWAGVATLGLGVCGLGLGAVFTVQAIDKNNESNGNCQGNSCTSAGRDDRLAAHSAGNAASIALASGVALIATGAGVYVWGTRSERRSSGHALSVRPWLAKTTAGAALQGRF